MTVEDFSNEIVIVGRSNVGKSSIMKALTGHSVDIGQRPGVTLEPQSFDFDSGRLAVTDMPGFGFMSGVSSEKQDRIRTEIVRYMESNADRIVLAVHVIDANSFVEIVDRWIDRDEVPHDLDLHNLLLDLGVPFVIAVNKIDKVCDKNEAMDEITDRFGYLPPWTQWRDVFAPISAKKQNTSALFNLVKENLREQGNDDLIQYINR